MREIVDLAQKVARLPATVLIQGESGTGKELLARLLHRESGGTNAPFIAVNLAAVPKDLVESTLFGHERGSFTGAHGNPNEKQRVAAGENLENHRLIARTAALLAGEGSTGAGAASLRMAEAIEREHPDGRVFLEVAAAIPSLRWTVVVEQPTSEAFALSDQLETQLVFVILGALILTVAFGYYGGRSFIRPILALTRGTEAIAAGHLEERVAIGGTDELHQLGESLIVWPSGLRSCRAT
jgi:methyl-accepting chemotaxis protein